MAQATALAFALVSVWGGFAHACHGSLHGLAQESAVHQAHVDAVTAASHEDHAPGPDHTSHKTSHKSTHPCCADLQCHGGVAIVTAGVITIIPHAVSESFVISDQAHEDWHLAALDRPPRSSVQT
jgi:hypothetical protein